LLVALIVGGLLSIQFKDSQLKNDVADHVHRKSLKGKFVGMLKHSIDELFSVGKFLILGAFVAAFIQTTVKTATLLDIGQGPLSSNLVMMGLAYVLSLCSEADAFVAHHLEAHFQQVLLLPFLFLDQCWILRIR
jgi:uncharacterized membrane protein YraQ (UPF0718 family)